MAKKAPVVSIKAQAKKTVHGFMINRHRPQVVATIDLSRTHADRWFHMLTFGGIHNEALLGKYSRSSLFPRQWIEQGMFGNEYRKGNGLWNAVYAGLDVHYNELNVLDLCSFPLIFRLIRNWERWIMWHYSHTWLEIQLRLEQSLNGDV